MQLLQGITANLIRNMGRQDTSDKVESEALARLSAEYGETLAVVGNEDDKLRFAVLNEENDSLQRSLSQEESEHLQGQLTRITMEIVNRNMIDGQEVA
jgi:hypothetical protein